MRSHGRGGAVLKAGHGGYGANDDIVIAIQQDGRCHAYAVKDDATPLFDGLPQREVAVLVRLRLRGAGYAVYGLEPTGVQGLVAHAVWNRHGISLRWNKGQGEIR